MACQVVGGTPGLPAHRSGGLPPYSNHENHNKHHLVGTHISTTGDAVGQTTSLCSPDPSTLSLLWLTDDPPPPPIRTGLIQLSHGRLEV